VSRSGYSDDCENYACWRGAVESALHGKRGQAFLLELVHALDALPEKRLTLDSLQRHGGLTVCALGAVGRARGMNLESLENKETDDVAEAFGIAPAMAKEITYVNDEVPLFQRTTSTWKEPNDEERFTLVRKWALEHLLPETLLGEEASK
jgi:hypothetical protein